MPVQGPSYSREEADKTFEEVWKLLNTKYGLFRMPSDDPSVTHVVQSPRYKGKKMTARDIARHELRLAIHSCFEKDSWETF